MNASSAKPPEPPVTPPEGLPEWSLRADLLVSLHRWPIPLLAFLAGSLLAILLGYLFPAGYEAEVDLYVAYNGDAIYVNADDYKNWQVNQLDAFATTNPVLDETLRRLRQQDPYWETVSRPIFRTRLETLWRNTGRWRLIAHDPDPGRSQAAVETWADAYLEQYRQAAQVGLTLLDLDRQLQALSAQQAQAVARQGQIEALFAKLAMWQVLLTDRPAPAMNALERWQVWSIIAEAAAPNDAWEVLLDSFPPVETDGPGYLEWITQVIATVNEETGLVAAQSASLIAQKEALTAQYQSVVAENYGLSANLQVGRIEPAELSPQASRPVGALALVGGLLGLLAWALGGLALPLLRAKR